MVDWKGVRDEDVARVYDIRYADKWDIMAYRNAIANGVKGWGLDVRCSCNDEMTAVYNNFKYRSDIERILEHRGWKTDDGCDGEQVTYRKGCDVAMLEFKDGVIDRLTTYKD